MSLLLSVIKAFGGPGSPGFLAVLVAIGLFLIYVWPRRRPVSVAWFVTIAAVHLILGLPLVANAIADPLVSVPAADTAALQGVRTLVVLDGDNRRGRLSAALRVWRIAAPQRIIVSGEPWLRDHLIEAGVPARVLTLESETATTLEQMEMLRSMARSVADGPPGVIASRLQMPRVEGLARAMGIDVTLVIAPVDREPARSLPWVAVPSYAALRVSRDALYEHAALAYYRRRGLIVSTRPAGSVVSNGDGH